MSKYTKVKLICEITGNPFYVKMVRKTKETDFALNWRTKKDYKSLSDEEKVKIADKIEKNEVDIFLKQVKSILPEIL